MIKKRKINYNNMIITIVLIASFTLFIYSIINILAWYKDSKKTTYQVKKITSIVEVKDIKPTKIDEEIINPPKDEKNPYWDYIKTNLIDVDFNKLKSINSDTAGWIQVNGTNINYPFVQTSDNKYYLKHSFDKSYNQAGWVFLDYRNNINDLDKNTILYAHGRIDKTMFGSLKNLLSSNWYNDNKNHIIKLSTEKSNSLWQVFSVYHIPTTNDYIQTAFKSNDEFYVFINMLHKRSVYNFNVELNQNDKILTLSTCYNDKEKVVMHAKLIRIQNK